MTLDLHERAAVLDVRVVGADVHQRADAAAAAADGDALEQLADLVEEHDGDGLVEVAAALDDRQRDRAERRHGHQEVLVEDLPVSDAERGLAQDVPADDPVGGGVQDAARREGEKGQIGKQQQGRGGGDAPQHFLLLAVHNVRRRSRSRAPPCGRPSARPS